MIFRLQFDQGQTFFISLMSEFQVNGQELPCTRCTNAEQQNRSGQEQRFIPILICPDGHSLCRNCYESYQTIQKRRCPYDGKQLRIDRPIKALKLVDLNSFNANVTAYLKMNKQSQNIIRNIERVKKDIEQLRDSPNVLRARAAMPQIPLNHRSKLTQDLDILRKQLAQWKERTDFQHLVLWLTIVVSLGLIQLASTIFQIYILAWSIHTYYQQIPTIIFYFVILYLTTGLVYYKQIFDMQVFKTISLNGIICQVSKLPFIMLIYFRLIFDISIKTVDIYSNRHRQMFELKDNLAFSRVNFSFFAGKSIIFLQYFIRLFDLTFSRLNQAVLVFSLIEIIAFIACDILNYKNTTTIRVNK